VKFECIRALNFECMIYSFNQTFHQTLLLMAPSSSSPPLHAYPPSLLLQPNLSSAFTPSTNLINSCIYSITHSLPRFQHLREEVYVLCTGGGASLSTLEGRIDKKKKWRGKSEKIKKIWA
jgi:hypothetical protein